MKTLRYVPHYNLKETIPKCLNILNYRYCCDNNNVEIRIKKFLLVQQLHAHAFTVVVTCVAIYSSYINSPTMEYSVMPLVMFKVYLEI